MAKVLLGVTGSVAAIRTPELYQVLKQASHQVKVVATQASLYFFDPALLTFPSPLGGEGTGVRGQSTGRLGPPHPNPLPPGERDKQVVILDEDEWPGRGSGKRYQRDDLVVHIELRRWADLFLIAPLDANTLAKLAAGLSDNCLTCVWRAWEPARPVVLAPAMNTLMWEHPLTSQHFRQLAVLAGTDDVPVGVDLDSLIDTINRRCANLRVVNPQSKRLACGDIGAGAMASLEDILAAVDKAKK